MEIIELRKPLNDDGIASRVEDCEKEATSKATRKEKAAESGGKIIWRGANFLMTLFFIMASGVQFNDPDPFLWVPLYGTAAILTACLVIQPNLSGHKRWKCVYWAHAVFCVGMFCYAFIELMIAAANPESDGSLNPLTYEEGRELAGVMITAVWMFICKQSPTIRSKTSCKTEKWCGAGILLLLFSLLPLILWVLCYSDVMSSSYISLCSDFYVDEFSF